MNEASIKERLNAYRRQKFREEMTESFKFAIQTVLPWNQNEDAKELLLVASQSNVEDLQDTESNCSDDSINQSQCTLLKTVMYLLCFLLWTILYVIAIEFEFGTVYLVLSMLIFIWINTHTRPKKPGELSAYSVFNPNCTAIEGTLDASQFEREIRYGIGYVR